MALSALVVKPLYEDSISGGVAETTTEIRVILQEKDGGAAYANKTNVEYWIIEESAPTVVALHATNGTTNASGEFVIDTTGTFTVGTSVFVMFHTPAGVGGLGDDEYGFGNDVVTAT